MTFFNKVIANESKNRMSLWNISTVMAPNLFFSRSKHSDYEELLLANTAAHIIRLMLRYQKILWKVSDSSVAVQCPYELYQVQGDVSDPGSNNPRHKRRGKQFTVARGILHHRPSLSTGSPALDVTNHNSSYLPKVLRPS